MKSVAVLAAVGVLLLAGSAMAQCPCSTPAPVAVQAYYPAPAYTSYYAPAVTAYYAPAYPVYAPYVVARPRMMAAPVYAAPVYAPPVVVARPVPYVPGEPVRNVLRAMAY